MHSFKISLLPALFLMTLLACQNEPQQSDFDQSRLTGRWEIDKAWRNGKQTETLTGTYYEFGEDGAMRTNLTPTLVEDEFSYDFSGNEIKQKSEPAVIYTVQSLTDSLLVFSMTINKFPFRLQLRKALPPTEGNADPTDTL